MTQGQLERAILPDGSVRMTSGESTFQFTRPAAGVLVVTITGYDKGQFGTAPLAEIGRVLSISAPLHLFVDARNAVGATMRVSEDWTRFLTRHAADLKHVHVLAGSRMVELTVAIARHLSRTHQLIEIYSDSNVFEAQLQGACKQDWRSARR
jgi:hypothetical protein